VFGLLLGFTIPTSAGQPLKTGGKPDLEVSLLVYDCAGIQAALLSRALDQTKVIFGNAGVVVAPVICTQDEFQRFASRLLMP
jgi:hypothetical protein